jgi:hypothetical protein
VSEDPYRTLGVRPGAGLTELVAARRRLALELHPDVGGDSAAMQAVNQAFEEARRRLAERPPPGQARGVLFDSPSFTIDVLPVDAYEALLVVTSWMGEVLVDDPPYVLEVFLDDPAPCWCRLDLVPDAGATSVSLAVVGVEPDPTPDPELVRDVFVANLNRLGEG